MTWDQHQDEGPGSGGGDPTPTPPTITAGYTARWSEPSGPHPGEHQKSVVRKSHIEPACGDSTGLNNDGFSITLTESFAPDLADRHIVRWRAGELDETETFANRADAVAAYERLIRELRACAEAPDGRSPGTRSW